MTGVEKSLGHLECPLLAGKSRWRTVPPPRTRHDPSCRPCVAASQPTEFAPHSETQRMTAGLPSDNIPSGRGRFGCHWRVRTANIMRAALGVCDASMVSRTIPFTTSMTFDREVRDRAYRRARNGFHHGPLENVTCSLTDRERHQSTFRRRVDRLSRVKRARGPRRHGTRQR